MSGPKHPLRKYPWEKWFKEGTTHILKRGVHFKPTVRVFMVYAYTVAKGMGVKAKLEPTNGDVGLKISVPAKGRRKSA